MQNTCCSVLNILVMGLVLGPSFMVISIMGVLLYAKVSPLYNVLLECIIVVYMYSTVLQTFEHISAQWVILMSCTLRHLSLAAGRRWFQLCIIKIYLFY